MSRSPVTRPRRNSVLVNYRKSVYYAFKSDVESFLEKFVKENTLNYADFANMWQLAKFTFIFADQSYVKPLKILCDVCFRTIKKYILFQSNPFMRIGAFYLLYGLYYKQPIQHLVKIRLTLEEYRKIKSLMDEMLNRGQYDVLYIFTKMKSDDAFVFVAQWTPLSVLTKSSITNIEADDTFKSTWSESALQKFEDILKDETVQALDKTCNDYEVMLKDFTREHPGLVPFKTTAIQDLKDAHQRVFQNECTVAEPATSAPQTNRQSIREKALANKTAQYRGSRKVITALDLDDDRDST